MEASYKSLKEDFVSNLTGGSISEINYVTAVAPVSRSKSASGHSDRLYRLQSFFGLLCSQDNPSFVNKRF
jgi:hypothetical protein